MKWSERWLAYNIDTHINHGADPHRAVEFWRRNGIPLEEEWPSDVPQERFYDKPPYVLFDLAKDFLDKWELRHDTVRGLDAMWDALQYSPLGCSVGWNGVDENGYWYKSYNGPDTHWSVIIGGEYGKYWLFADSAEPIFKKVAWNIKPDLVKRYAIKKRDPNEQLQLSLFAKILHLLSKMLDLVKSSGSGPASQETHNSTPPPQNAPEAQISRSEALYRAAKASIGKEMSPEDNAPDELACAESLCRVIQLVYPDFPLHISTARLYEELRKSPHFKQTSTPVRGAVSIFPTEFKNGFTNFGHCGVVGNTHVMSNQSFLSTTHNYPRGTWQPNYTRAEWEAAAKQRGLPLYYFLPQ